MPYPGILMAVVVTVAVGAAIYAFFVENEREKPMRHNSRNNDDCNYTYTPRTATNPRPRRNREEECSLCRTPAICDKVTLPCSHTFHRHCLADWFETDRTCPNCRMRQYASY